MLALTPQVCRVTGSTHLPSTAEEPACLGVESTLERGCAHRREKHPEVSAQEAGGSSGRRVAESQHVGHQSLRTRWLV